MGTEWFYHVVMWLLITMSVVNAVMERLTVLREDQMPMATVDVESTQRFDLKTCPEGFVVLRRMSYGQILQRRMFTKLEIGGDSKNRGDFRGELAMANAKITEFEYAKCVVDHNLEDASGRKLDLTKVSDFNMLDPRIGQEIESYITEMNNFEAEEEN